MNVLERVMKAINHEEVYPVPVVLWDLAPWMPKMFNVNINSYYHNTEKKLAVFTKLQETFPEVLLFPGFHPDFGVVIQASAFGGRIQWLEDDAPYVYPSLEKIEDVNKIKPINPQNDGLMPYVLREWEYMLKNVSPKIIEKYGYVRGHAVCMGPAETAGLVLGYEKLFYGYFENPSLVHKLLDIITDETIKWIKAQEKVTGKLERLFLYDHLSTQLSPSLYDEYFHPYVKAVFDEFKYVPIRLWHNEGRSSHVYNRIRDLGCNVYNFGADCLAEIKEAVGDCICLMGNLNSVKLTQQSPEEIKNDVINCIKIGAKGGGYLISGTGGLSAGTTVEKVQAIVDASNSYENHTLNLK